jgi:predicted transcriptional regulator
MRDRLATFADRRRARDALSAAKRGYALRLREHGATEAQIGLALGLSPQRVSQLLAKAERLAAQPSWHAQFPARALNFLKVSDLAEKPEIEAAEALARFSRRELVKQPNLGKGALAAIEAWLAGHDLTWRAEVPTAEPKRTPIAEITSPDKQKPQPPREDWGFVFLR